MRDRLEFGAAAADYNNANKTIYLFSSSSSESYHKPECTAALPAPFLPQLHTHSCTKTMHHFCCGKNSIIFHLIVAGEIFSSIYSGHLSEVSYISDTLISDYDSNEGGLVRVQRRKMAMWLCMEWNKQLLKIITIII